MRQSIQKITLVGLFTALVFVGTMIKIDIPIAGGSAMVHLGNAICIICGIFLGPIYGSLAAGMGSFLFDLFSPIFITSAPFSFIFKFCLAYVSAKIYSTSKFKFMTKTIFSGIMGCLVYIFLHTSKLFIYNVYFLKLPLNIVYLIITKNLVVSLLNAFVSIFISVVLLKSLKDIGTIKIGNLYW